MKKYKVVVSYAGAIGMDVEAENEGQAIAQAVHICDNMDDDAFLYELEPQLEETNAEEIK